MAHPLDASAPTSVWSRPLPSLQQPVLEGLAGLEGLALQGRWREVVQRCTAAPSMTDTATALTAAAYQTCALLKLRMLDRAAAELSKLGGLESGSSVSRGQPLVPFALRLLAAEVPWRMGRRQVAVDRLYALLDWCIAQLAAAGSAGGTVKAAAGAPALSTSSGQLASLWQHRHRQCLLLLVNKHCQLRQYVPALRLLDGLLRDDASDAEAWAEAGMVQAMLGDLAASQRTLQHAERLLLAGQSDGTSGELGSDMLRQNQWRQLLVHRSRGLLSFLHRDYRGAAKDFGAALAVDPSDAASASNHAACSMYSCQLTEAVAELEGAFQRCPAALMQEAVVMNLASHLELAAAPGSVRQMANWIAAAAPDDFDLACTKTQGALGSLMQCVH